jgi:hypothetical protein
LRDIDPRGLAEIAIADADPLHDQLATPDYRRKVGRRVFAQVLEGLIQGELAA